MCFFVFPRQNIYIVCFNHQSSYSNFPFPSTLDLISSTSHLNDHHSLQMNNATANLNNCGSSSSQALRAAFDGTTFGGLVDWTHSIK